MPAKAELVLAAIKASLETIPDATVERNSVLPEKIPGGGLIILRDGDPGRARAGARRLRECLLPAHGRDRGLRRGKRCDGARRCLRYLLQQIGVALEADPSLGDLAFGMTYGRPEPSIEAVAAHRRLRARRSR
jgi:hypothetical protein